MYKTGPSMWLTAILRHLENILPKHLQLEPVGRLKLLNNYCPTVYTVHTSIKHQFIARANWYSYACI